MMKRLLGLGLILLLSACGMPPSSTPAPTPEAIYISYPQALQPWSDQLGNCAASNPLVGLYFFPSSSQQSDPQSNEIVLELGDSIPSTGSIFLSLVGWEQIVVVINQENKLSQLGADELQSIFTGEMKEWPGEAGQTIQVWVLPRGDPVRTVFDQAVLPRRSMSSDARLAPDPSAMLEEVSRDAASIGYLPQSYIPAIDTSQTSKVKTITLDKQLMDELRKPVIAATLGEPTGSMREVLVCLQAHNP